MTILEIEAKKAALARSILNIDNEDLLNEISKTIKDYGKMPCMYSDEEIQVGADRFILAYKNKDKSRFVSHEEMEKRHTS